MALKMEDLSRRVLRGHAEASEQDSNAKVEVKWKTWWRRPGPEESN